MLITIHADNGKDGIWSMVNNSGCLLARMDDEGRPVQFFTAPSRKLARLFIRAMALRGERYGLYRAEAA